ncbi:MAG: hypothetical protein U0744_02485 [Gemmataceae bacterium]
MIDELIRLADDGNPLAADASASTSEDSMAFPIREDPSAVCSTMSVRTCIATYAMEGLLAQTTATEFEGHTRPVYEAGDDDALVDRAVELADKLLARLAR